MLRLASRSSSLAARGARLCRRSSSLSLPGVARRLGEVTKVEMLEAEEPERIGAIWDSFHEHRPELAGCSVTAEEHLKITERARESPLFIFPVRREQGHFLLLSQFNAPSDMFVMTFLEDYKQNPAAAQPWLSVTLFGELLTSKAVGLLRADIAPERLSKQEGEHVLGLARHARSHTRAPRLRRQRRPVRPPTAPSGPPTLPRPERRSPPRRELGCQTERARERERVGRSARARAGRRGGALAALAQGRRPCPPFGHTGATLLRHGQLRPSVDVQSRRAALQPRRVLELLPVSVVRGAKPPSSLQASCASEPGQGPGRATTPPPISVHLPAALLFGASKVCSRP